MRKLKFSMLLIAALLTGCENMSETQKGTAKGAGIGAAAGAAIGAVSSSENRGRHAATGAAIGAGVGAAGGYIWSKRMEQQKAEMEQATSGTGIDVEKTADNQIRVMIPSDAGFDVNRADIKAQLGTVLTKFAESMRNNPATTIRVIGHTDSTGSDSINDPLSRERALSTRDYLVARGVGSNRVSTDGRGSREPVASNSTDSGRAQNRRVEIYVAEPAA
ncbi:MAG TPA: OmpA family protein [Burkholderiales bacterium]|jgi:outer membrane protein OmpA-like peptidoglycan-associated protein|nr:OmpA family protein [Burkholderiales bacterium]